MNANQHFGIITARDVTLSLLKGVRRLARVFRQAQYDWHPQNFFYS